MIEEHAELVRHIFGRYLVLGNVRLLADELRAQGIVTPRRTSITKRETGGRPFSRGQLYRILNNVTYAGEIAHGDKRFPGQHVAIIDAETFARAQQLLADHRNGVRQRTRAAHPSLLAGKLRDTEGRPLVATHTKAGNVRYRYYVSDALQHDAGQAGSRIPAREIEGAVAARVAEAFDDPLDLMATLKLAPPADRIDAFFAQCAMLADACRRRCFATLSRLVSGVAVHDDRLDITSETDAIAALTGAAPGPDTPRSMLLSAHVRLARSGRALRLVQRDGAAAQAEANPALVGKLVQARRWWEALRGGDLDVTRLAEREGVTRSYICRIVRFAFLSPEMVTALLAGTQRAGVSAAMLRADGAIPLSWEAQRRLFLPGAEDAAA
ncbi:recombinase family protein [Sphingomonas sp. 7/4-4]|uniref:recombinase family protein n=1 Tax=Sphingomonas sp. 7/4-4 TaxID=3018446 RepID=UPI0022F3D2FB|nr:recombinase family protein [Sphingomonas sp. 7/4-4]WBY08139.1 recombinase family protein [Sphingomonas sp. 7/4-4]